MRRLSNALALAAVLATTALVAACEVQPAQGAPPPRGVTLTAVACDAGSICYTARWTAVSDNAGAADSYRVRVAAPGVALDTTVAVTSVAFKVPCAPGANGSITADVWSVRRGKQSATSARTVTAFSCPDVPPPAPDSVIVQPDSSVNPNPPAGDISGDSIPSPVGDGSTLFATPRATSPHFDFIRRTFTDYCRCFDNGAAGDSARAHAARMYDLEMSGAISKWVALNPTMDALRYVLMQTTFTEEPDTAGHVDPNSLTGKYQYDAREWFKAHPEYDYESMWLHDKTAGTPADSAHRLRFLIWANYRFAINPLDPGARAYTIDRLRRTLSDIPQATGIFIDEADGSALGRIRNAREGAGMDSLVWQDSVVSLVAQIRKALAPAMVQTNAAAYSPRPFDRRVGVAAGSMHLERMNKATGDMVSTWSFVDGLVADSTYVDLVNLETFQDFQRYGPGFFPRGNYADAVGRGEVFQLASYYMVVDSLAQRVGLHENGQRNPVTPDSTDLAIYYLDVGHPRAKRYVWRDTTDALGQTARTYRRDFDNAVVLARPITSYKYPVMTDTTAVPVPLPEGGPWSMVRARGQVVPLDSLRLRNSEAVILIRRQ
ncbi:MAG TPA: hypothetical protein VIQ60_12605 [Gemmatimonadaceae bacterium]